MHYACPSFNPQITKVLRLYLVIALLSDFMIPACEHTHGLVIIQDSGMQTLR